MERQICLVLNRNWKPISFCSVYHAVTKMMNERAMMVCMPDYTMIDSDEWLTMIDSHIENGILTPGGYLPRPEIIVSRYYDKLTLKNPACNRKNLIKRDGLICQYTGRKLAKDDATIDHILPRSRGGETSWDNCVITSFSVNNKKGPRTPEEVSYRLIKKPTKPMWSLSEYLPEDFVMPDSWKLFFNEKRN